LVLMPLHVSATIAGSAACADIPATTSSHSIDSLRHPLIQLSDLVIYTTRKFLECDNGYRPNRPAEAKNFFASCYDRVQTRMWRTNLIDVKGEEEQEAHALLKLCQSTHNGHWKRNYTIT
jgi:hypothetical protein